MRGLVSVQAVAISAVGRELGVHGRLAAAQIVAVYDIVVDQGPGVKHLNGRRGGEGLRFVAAHGPAAQQ